MYKSELVFASGNPNKVAEVGQKMENKFRLLGLKDIGCQEDLPETGNTLEENARQKARFVWDHFKRNVFADDTGIEVDALDGRPGVNTAFFGGPEKSAEKNNQRLLHELEGKTNRHAQFRTVVCLIIEGEEFMFEGKVRGEIMINPRGDKGFGYDPLFKPDGKEVTYAEMDMEEKNKYSHRGRAIAQLQQFLESFDAQK